MAVTFGTRVAGSSVESCPLQQGPKPKPVHWIEIELIGEDNQPVPWEEYEVTLPNGDVARGFLDAKGRARIENIDDAGQGQVTFPKLDQEAWAPV